MIRQQRRPRPALSPAAAPAACPVPGPRSPIAGLVLAAALVLVGATSHRAEAATWIDPTLEHALRASETVLLIEATDRTKPDRDGAWPFRILRSLRAKPRASFVRISGLHDPDREEAPKIAPGRRFVAVLQLRGRQRSLGPATPTFGLFPVTDGAVVAPFRDTSVRVTVPLRFYEAFLKLALHRVGQGLDKSDKAWLKRRREFLDEASLEPNADTAALIHAGLEALYWAGEAQDVPRIKRHLGSKVFQIRASACRALGMIGGAAAVDALLKTLTEDKIATVTCHAALGLGILKDPPKGLGDRLVAAMDKIPTREVRLAPTVEDPRRNALAAPRATIYRLLGRLPCERAVPRLLEGLDSSDEALISAAAEALVAREDPEILERVIAHMRPAGDAGYTHNRWIARALARLAGRNHGLERDAWKAWWTQWTKTRAERKTSDAAGQ